MNKIQKQIFQVITFILCLMMSINIMGTFDNFYTGFLIAFALSFIMFGYSKYFIDKVSRKD